MLNFVIVLESFLFLLLSFVDCCHFCPSSVNHTEKSSRSNTSIQHSLISSRITFLLVDNAFEVHTRIACKCEARCQLFQLGVGKTLASFLLLPIRQCDTYIESQIAKFVYYGSIFFIRLNHDCASMLLLDIGEIRSLSVTYSQRHWAPQTEKVTTTLVRSQSGTHF